MTSGVVFEIQHFSIHDGPGIRTTVFLKGCPLRCLWCHNPEGQDGQPEIFFSPEKCIGCRSCEQACTHGGQRFEQPPGSPTLTHIFRRDDCIRCGDCTQACYAGALEITGRPMSASEVFEQVLQDRPFYQTSGGGLTLSGGEPMQQFEFACALLGLARAAGLHTCLETSGCSTAARYVEIAPLVDLFYYDIKEIDDDRHRQYTGLTNRAILQNLTALDQAGAATVLRCPIIPGLNDRPDHFAGIAAIANRLRGVREIHVLPYHPLGTSKTDRLGKLHALAALPQPAETQVQAWVSQIQQHTAVPVISQ